MVGNWREIPFYVRKKFSCQKSRAKQRGIPFELTFEQWWQIWQESGHWSESKYVMCRHGDRGPYAVGNVRIATASENSREYYRGGKGNRVNRGRYQRLLLRTLYQSREPIAFPEIMAVACPGETIRKRSADPMYGSLQRLVKAGAVVTVGKRYYQIGTAMAKALEAAR
jgi:hypothetical protein